MDKHEIQFLRAADSHGLVIPKDDACKAICNTLVEGKLLTVKTMLDGNSLVGNPRIFLAYKITPKGRKALAAVVPPKE